MQDNSSQDYGCIARRIRRSILDIVHRTGSPHVGSSFSAVEVLVDLYFSILRITPGTTDYPDRDRFILSKGHACSCLYAVLSERGYLAKEDLLSFAVDGGMFEQHPNMDTSRGIEVSTGSLGHGLSIGAGMALAGAIDDRKYRVFVLLSDGELNEGSVWEAVMFASHHKLTNLVALVDANGMQALGHTSQIIDLNPISNKWEAFGWHTQEVDGHDFDQIDASLGALSAEKPNAIVLKTVKGKGVSFMEDNLLWHYRSPDDQEYERALKELSE